MAESGTSATWPAPLAAQSVEPTVVGRDASLRERSPALAGVLDPIVALPAAARHLVTMFRPGPGAGGASTAPAAPTALPPGLIVPVPGVGDVFVRDTHPQGSTSTRGTLLLLHGWLVASDPHWWQHFEPLRRAGWRVVAVDARGHGRGLRPEARFRLDDCATDVAALLEVLSPGPTVAVGYSMGGAIAQILAFRHPELLAGLVLCATAAEWRRAPQMRVVWPFMGALQVGWRLAPRLTWSRGIRFLHGADPPEWFGGEIARGAAWDIAEAGREIGRFDSRPWIGSVTVPSVVVTTTNDVLVPVSSQRALAHRLRAPIVPLAAGHLAPATDPPAFTAALLGALGILTGETAATPAGIVSLDSRRGPRSLARGATGDAVADVQRLLAGRGAGQVDGIFGPATEAAVRRFQTAAGLDPSGRLDRATWAALLGDRRR